MTCPDCNGSGTYTGLNTVEPCHCQLETVSSCQTADIQPLKTGDVVTIDDPVLPRSNKQKAKTAKTVLQAIDDALNLHATISNHFGLVERLNRLKKRTFTDIVSEEDARTAKPPAYTAIDQALNAHATRSQCTGLIYQLYRDKADQLANSMKARLGQLEYKDD